MNNIEWKEDAVCYADNYQWKPHNYGTLVDINGSGNLEPIEKVVNDCDFQLNEPRIGDYIEKSELDTEQKYSDVVEVFELFGFEPYLNYELNKITFCKTGSRERTGLVIVKSNVELDYDAVDFRGVRERKLTHNQIMSIGKLKRLMNEREDEERTIKGAIDTSQAEVSVDNVKATSNKYEREITDRQGNSATVDVYDVLKAFDVTCPATQHAVKKLLCSGLRGHKDLSTDLIEAKESIVRAIELNGG